MLTEIIEQTRGPLVAWFGDRAVDVVLEADLPDDFTQRNLAAALRDNDVFLTAPPEGGDSAVDALTP